MNVDFTQFTAFKSNDAYIITRCRIRFTQLYHLIVSYEMAAYTLLEPTLNELVSLRDALANSPDDIIGIDRRLPDIQPSRSASIHRRTGMIAERGIRPQGEKKSTYPSSDRVTPQTALGRFSMETIEVDGHLKGHSDYAVLLAASSSKDLEDDHTADWDTFVLPKEFFQWHDHVVDERSALGDGSESDDPFFCLAAPSPVQDFLQQEESYSDPRPPPPAPPEFINAETCLWKYWSHLVNSPLDPFFGKLTRQFSSFPGELDDVLESVDPWDVSLNQSPPFYRAAFMTPPYISGMPDARVVMEIGNPGNGGRE